MYDYCKLTKQQEEEIVRYRRHQQHPWHSPPHWQYEVQRQFLLTAACYEHQPSIGTSLERMTEFETELLTICAAAAHTIYAWCVLPNHYHVLLRTEQITALLKALGQLHGRTSFRWNGEEQQRGRKVWFNCFERPIESHGHFWASVNYVHHNPVKHRYVTRWQDWAWSSATEYLEKLGTEQAAKIWRAFPILNYGEGWDVD